MTTAAPRDGDLVALLHRLYHEQRASAPDPYLLRHGGAGFIRGQVRVFRWYAGHLPARGTVLDLGCAHAPDACLIRAAHGPTIDLHGCDFHEHGRYSAFHRFAGLKYARLEHPARLPYEDAGFDAVVASGVLEHTAMDYEALKEAYRVLRPGGKLVVSYLPNALSYQEFIRRRLLHHGFHRRLYGRAETTQMLKRAGFYPIVPVRVQHFAWEDRLDRVPLPPRLRRGLAGLAKALLPYHLISSTLCCIAEKVTAM